MATAVAAATRMRCLLSHAQTARHKLVCGAAGFTVATATCAGGLYAANAAGLSMDRVVDCGGVLNHAYDAVVTEANVGPQAVRLINTGATVVSAGGLLCISYEWTARTYFTVRDLISHIKWTDSCCSIVRRSAMCTMHLPMLPIAWMAGYMGCLLVKKRLLPQLTQGGK